MKRIEWENYQDGDSTPLSAENLNLMQDNIEEELGKKANQTTTYTKTEVDTSLDLKADKLKYIRLQLSNIDVAFTSLVLNTWSVSETSGDITSNSTSIIAPKNGLMRISASIFVRYFGSSSFQFCLTKNGADIARMPTTVIESGTMILPSMIVPVEQGDVFRIRLDSTGWTSGARVGYLVAGNGISWFQAEMIE